MKREEMTPEEADTWAQHDTEEAEKEEAYWEAHEKVEADADEDEYHRIQAEKERAVWEAESTGDDESEFPTPDDVQDAKEIWFNRDR